MIIENQQTVYVAWTNSDLTEGRGIQYPLAVCSLEATATRIGKGNYVQGDDCPITRENSVRIEGKWLVPGRIIGPSPEDMESEKSERKRRAVLMRAKAAGLTDEDIETLRKG